MNNVFESCPFLSLIWQKTLTQQTKEYRFCLFIVVFVFVVVVCFLLFFFFFFFFFFLFCFLLFFFFLRIMIVTYLFIANNYEALKRNVEIKKHIIIKQATKKSRSRS